MEKSEKNLQHHVIAYALTNSARAAQARQRRCRQIRENVIRKMCEFIYYCDLREFVAYALVAKMDSIDKNIINCRVSC